MEAADHSTDTVLVSVSCHLPREALHALTVYGRALVVETPTGAALAPTRVQIIQEDAGVRQKELERTLESALVHLQRCGISQDLAAREDVEIRVYLSLCPSSGQAGVVLTAAMLMPWYELGAYVWVDALA